MRYKVGAFFRCTVFFLICSEGWAQEQLTVIGDAYSLEHGQLLYSESHYYSEDQLDHRVVYTADDQTELAEKFLDYRYGKSTPSFIQFGRNYPETISVKWSGDTLLTRYKVAEGPALEASFTDRKPVVVDAGFDHFIRANWALLASGDHVDFFFPSPSRQSLIKLRAQKVSCSFQTESDICFEINSTNWLIRLLLDPIELAYDSDSMRLSRFRGLGNVSDDAGNGMRVDIQYRYTELQKSGEREGRSHL